MTPRRLILGWMDFDQAAASAEPRVALQAMLDREAVAEAEVMSGLPGNACIAGTQGGAVTAYDRDARCAAIVLGRPRWVDGGTARYAAASDHAAAALREYRSVGELLPERAHGNFALVVLDFARNVALLAIDRMGIERMCYARVGSLLVFSTSARAVAGHPRVEAPIDRQAIYEYLFCHMVPSPDTVFTGIGKLLPAQRAMVRAGSEERGFYWHLAFEPDKATSLERQGQQFRDLLTDAVGRQLDGQPAGAFLSGGTDSSTIAGLLGKVSQAPAKTFSIGFEADGYDELEYARLTSRHFSTQAHEYYVTPADVADAMPVVAASYDEPFGNASAVPTYLCARLAVQHGIEVMLAGDGGDELFAGNERYAKQGVFEHYQTLPGALRRSAEPLLMGLPFANAVMPIRKLQSYVRQARVPLPDRLEAYNLLLRTDAGAMFEPEFMAAVDRDRPLELMREAYFRARSPGAVDRMMHMDHKFTLADNDLRKVGRMCEAAGLDVRFPLLDDDLVTFSGTLRYEHKIRNGNLRWFFKHALKDFLPAETIRKSKHGFGLPFGLWSRQPGPLRDRTVAALDAFAQRGIVQPAYLAELRRLHAQEHASYYGVMLWVMCQLELWLQNSGARPAARR